MPNIKTKSPLLVPSIAFLGGFLAVAVAIVIYRNALVFSENWEKMSDRLGKEGWQP